MSELRDLTTALRAFEKRFSHAEECMVILLRNSEQQAQWRHDQKNRAQMEEGLRLEAERAMQQVQEACGAISHRLVELVERLDNQAQTRLEDIKEVKGRLSRLENHEETTKT